MLRSYLGAMAANIEAAVVEDPNETKDLASEHPEVVKELSALVRAMHGASSERPKGRGGVKEPKKKRRKT